MSLAQRLKQSRGQARISQRELAKRSGLSQQLISKLENGLVESTTEVFRLAEILRVDVRWLATGKGDAQGGENIAVGPAITAYVPLISWVAAGTWRDVADPYPPGMGEVLVPVTCRTGPNAYALRVQGDSMEPVFPNGSIIIIGNSTCSAGCSRWQCDTSSIVYKVTQKYGKVFRILNLGVSVNRNGDCFGGFTCCKS